MYNQANAAHHQLNHTETKLPIELAAIPHNLRTNFPSMSYLQCFFMSLLSTET
jgi:hypothetical protein